MTQELTQQQLDVIAKAEKLYALAGNNSNEHEAASALAAAQRLLEAYNLDALTFSQNSGNQAQGRDNRYIAGGLYMWQRTLWGQIAKLHFCRYWYVAGQTKGSKYQHRVLGSKTNVMASRLMAEYLQGTVERLARDWAHSRHENIFSKPSISFREGMAGKLVQRLETLRNERLEEDRLKQREETARRAHPSYVATNALVLQSVIDAENDANEDFLHGDGYSARQRAARANAEADYQARVKIREQWKLDNPEEWAKEQAAAAAMQEKWRKEEERKAKRRSKQPVHYARTKQYKGDVNAYWAGNRKGDDVGLNQQVAHSDKNKLS